MVQKRIAFSGAAGTGKSHLAAIVQKALGIPLCPIGSRTVCKEMGFEHAYDIDAAGKRMEFQRRLCAAKAEWERQHESFVTDRSHLDNLAYTTLHAVDSVDEEFVGMIRRANSVYTHVIHVDARAPDAFMDLNDPARHQNRVYHRHYAMLLAQLWTYYSTFEQLIHFHWLTTPVLAEREEQVRAFLRVRAST